jgi:Ca-activated chloride channel family protein
MKDDQSFSSWTDGDAESSTFGVSGDVTASSDKHDLNSKPLKLSVTPRHDCIGMLAKDQEHKDVTTIKICVNVKASNLPTSNDDDDDDIRSSIDVVAALDKSISMSGNKLRDCKRTLQLMIRYLNSKDRFGLVSYGTEAVVDFPASFMTPENKRRALQKILQIQTTGSTNLSGGLSLASQELEVIDEPNPVRSIFLLTDGSANLGIVDPVGLATMVQSLNDNTGSPNTTGIEDSVEGMEVFVYIVSDTSDSTKAFEGISRTKPPVSLFCFGYGTQHNSGTLRTMADASPGGAYYFVEEDEDVSAAFGDAMGGLLSVVAQSAVVALSVPPASAAKNVKILTVHHDETVERDYGTFTVTMGDFYAEESRDVVLDVQLSNVPSDTPLAHLAVSLTYTDTIQKHNTKEGPIACSIARPPTDHVSPSNVHVEEQWLRVYTATQMEAADEAAQANDLNRARYLLQANKDFLTSSSAYALGSLEVTALAMDVGDAMHAFSSNAVYRSTGTHFTKSAQMQMRRQRCMASKLAPPTTEGHLVVGDLGTQRLARYATQKKTALRQEFKLQYPKK